jgi:hypothetical protein
MEAEIKVEAKDGKLLLGPSFIKLQDKTTTTFQTKNLYDFKNYLQDGQIKIVFADSLVLEAYEDVNLLNPEYNNNPLAKCDLSWHPALELLIGNNGKTIGLESFSELLTILKKYLHNDDLFIADICKNLKVTKIVSIDREKDNRGNYLYSVKAEKGKNDFEFPEQIKFIMPLFDDRSNFVIEIPFMLIFSWEVSPTGAVSLQFKLNNLELTQTLRELSGEKIAEYFSDTATLTIYFGKLLTNKHLDEHLYKITQLPAENITRYK